MTDGTERWLPIPGWEDLYLISTHGRVRSLPRLDSLGRRRAGGLLKPGINKSGYPTVVLCRDGTIRSTRTIHSLIAAAFLGPCPKGQEVRHLDGVRAHSVLANLAYGTRSENSLDSVRHGTHRGLGPTCLAGHEWTPATTRLTSDGRRVCTVCEGQRESRRCERYAAEGIQCTRGDCDRPPIAKGLCRKHYMQQWRDSRDVA